MSDQVRCEPLAVRVRRCQRLLDLIVRHDAPGRRVDQENPAGVQPFFDQHLVRRHIEDADLRRHDHQVVLRHVVARRPEPSNTLTRTVVGHRHIESPRRTRSCCRIHVPAYVETVRRFSADPTGAGAMGIGLSDNPAFAGMHEASARPSRAGRCAAMEAILRGDVEHAHQPGRRAAPRDGRPGLGLLHLQRPGAGDRPGSRGRAAGPVRRPRRPPRRRRPGDDLRRPGRADRSRSHESGRYLFPETGFIDELGEGAAAGTSVNMPFEPYTGETAWLAAVRGAAPDAGRGVRAGRDRVAARRRLARVGPAGAPAGDDDGARRRRRGSSTRSRTGGRAGDGSRRAAAGTTRTGSCRGRGR